ncbi:MAG: hypothetical protein SGJ11_12115 [Phycisphaerae bacterium]|nr:hypothetical protein [Phycisphaerae bacterium]
MHLIEAAADDGATLIAQAADLAALVGGSHGVFIVGPQSAVHIARSLDLQVSGAFCPPLREPALARRSLRRALAPLRAERFVCWSRALHDDLRATHANIEIIVPEPSHAFVDASRIPCDRARVRASWRADDSVCVVGLLADPVAHCDVRRAADIVSTVAVRGLNVRLVVHPRAARSGTTAQWMNQWMTRWTATSGRESGLVHDPRIAQPWEIVHGLDVALVLGDGLATGGAAALGRRSWTTGQPAACSQLPSLWAVAAGVPVLSEVDCAEALQPPDVATTTFSRDDPLSATRTLVAWIADPPSRHRPADDARRADEADARKRAWMQRWAGTAACR